MRAALRLLASAQPEKFLTPGAPTGLAGLLTHHTPRSTLLYHYSAVLDKLKQIPESSVYRQSTEALTKYRLKIVEETIPTGLREWEQKVEMQLSEFPEAFKTFRTSNGIMAVPSRSRHADPRSTKAAWDGEREPPTMEGIRSDRERKGQAAKFTGAHKGFNVKIEARQPKLPLEPPYTAEQYVSSSSPAFL